MALGFGEIPDAVDGGGFGGKGDWDSLEERGEGEGAGEEVTEGEE